MRAGLGSQATRFSLRVVAECASTNTEMMDSPPADDGRVHVLFAERQSAGRGRRGRHWQSWPASASLTFSSLWHFNAGAPVPAGLSLVAGVAVARALESLNIVSVQLKWPNDVLVLGRKIAGILVELRPGRGRTPAAVIGIGINLALPPGADVPSALGITDVATHVAQPVAREPLAALILAELASLLDRYAVHGFPAVREAWQKRNAFADLPVRIEGDGSELSGRCLGVDQDGALLVETDQGVCRVLSGEVSLRSATA